MTSQVNRMSTYRACLLPGAGSAEYQTGLIECLAVFRLPDSSPLTFMEERRSAK